MERLAIVGTGISGMTCAHYLRDGYDITIFDKNDYIGGHTHTHRMKEGKREFTLDTGFIVFNLHTYKNLLSLFSELGVEKQKSDMSFSVYNLRSGLQYSTKTISEMFAQRKNLLSLRHWNFLLDINKFFKVALRDHKKIKNSRESIRSYCRRNGLSDHFIENYLAPMSSAVWSTPTKEIYEFPIALLLPFFFNHGMLGINRQYQWYTVRGGSDTYTKKIVKNSDLDIHLEEEVLSVEEKNDKVLLKTKKKGYSFDKVILASHSDESLRIAKGLPKEKKELLKAFGYNNNIAVLHTDSSIMPPMRKVWSSWNHIIKDSKASTIYWLNRLQRPNAKKDYFLSINPFQDIKEDKIIKKIRYQHPLFTLENFALQKKLQELNRDTRIFFAGAYFHYGFHEDGCRSGLGVVELLKK